MLRPRIFRWLIAFTLIGLLTTACGGTTPLQPTPIVPPTDPPTIAPQPTAAPPTPTLTSVPTFTSDRPHAKDTTTFVAYLGGEPETLDPSTAYEGAAGHVQAQIYEALIAYDGARLDRFVPVLVEAIPEPIALPDEGAQYVWTIKSGVQFADGQPLTAEDVAFSFWRTLLVGDPTTPAWLLHEAFFDVDDVTQLVLAPDGSLIGDPDGLRAASATQLIATCERVKQAIEFDNAKRTVTMTLVHSWGPFLPTITQAWAAAQSKAWVTAQGDWNGECDTWQNFYGVPKEGAPLYATANGTGPYQLDHWTPGEEIVLTANPHWHGGQPAITRVVLKPAIDLGTQLAQLQVGDVDRVVLDMPADEAQLEPQVAETCDALTGECQTIHAAGRLREYTQLPQAARAHLVFNFQIAADSPYIGSGQLDGEGVPPEFFGDVHIRRAFNYCFNWEALIQEVYVGRATQALALTLPGMPGYDGSPAYSFDLAKCEAEFKAATLKNADGQSVWETGYYLQVPRFPGDKFGKTLIDILAANLAHVNDKFLIVSLELPQTLMFHSMENGLLPIISGGWLEDIHDPHNWYQPFLLGGIAFGANLPPELQAKYAPLIDQGVKETDPARRTEIYRQLNQVVYEDAPLILLANRSGRLFLPMYVDGVLNGRSLNPLNGLYFAEMKKQ